MTGYVLLGYLIFNVVTTLIILAGLVVKLDAQPAFRQIHRVFYKGPTIVLGLFLMQLGFLIVRLPEALTTL